MIFILTHGPQIAYSPDFKYRLINHSGSLFPSSYRMMRGMYEVWTKYLTESDNKGGIFQSGTFESDNEVGIFQYRRYLTTSHIPQGYDVVVGTNHCPCCIYDQFNECHTIKNLEIAEQIINEEQFSYYIRIPNNQCCYWDNMFIMRKNDFNAYCKWIFYVLQQKSIIMKGEEDWLAERLTSYWIWKTFDQDKICRSGRIQI